MAVDSGHITIIQGAYRDIYLQVVNTKGEPVDVTGATSLACRFCQADGSLLSLTTEVSILSGPSGKFLVVMSATNSALLEIGDSKTIELEYTLAGKKTIVQFEGVLTVKPQLQC